MTTPYTEADAQWDAPLAEADTDCDCADCGGWRFDDEDDEVTAVTS